jgi:hypothetical protein
MMKIIALSFLLVISNALQAGSDLARFATFHASRFVAGMLIDKSYTYCVHKMTSGGSGGALKNEIIPIAGLIAIGYTAPKKLNQITEKYLPQSASWLMPQQPIDTSKFSQGSLAFWAGMNVVRIKRALQYKGII